ncbi:DUF3224 domain-containing protein [Cupriavidus lacunae]|uniref:DUF3224 domain-containing protein n=1 Tax=Cupriavidus lacunae TaxID=2666307 RepID=A0A370NL88_9BURK|nr:DUF3224 domain-containing protein [Cupriavidus lacunae]RDK06364.1 DUF3224 domain-containing protein [Cupriavidus lacunae]
MELQARGSFEVNLQALPLHDDVTGAALGRRSIDKVFSGDLQGNSHGEMLAAGTAVAGSAGYVAMELVSGVLNGRSGTFVLQHSGTMTRGAPSLRVSVVPDSGTGELLGLSGELSIDIVEGKHLYAMRYSLPDPA